MTYIQYSLDIEEGDILYDPIGSISILGDEGSLEEKSTYLDAFIEAFISGIESIDSDKVVRIDPLVEPDDIIFNFKNNAIKISYGSQTTTILNKSQFIEDLKNTTANFLKELDEFARTSKQPVRKLAKLRNFV